MTNVGIVTGGMSEEKLIDILKSSFKQRKFSLAIDGEMVSGRILCWSNIPFIIQRMVTESEDRMGCIQKFLASRGVKCERRRTYFMYRDAEGILKRKTSDAIILDDGEFQYSNSKPFFKADKRKMNAADLEEILFNGANHCIAKDEISETIRKEFNSIFTK